MVHFQSAFQVFADLSETTRSSVFDTTLWKRRDLLLDWNRKSVSVPVLYGKKMEWRNLLAAGWHSAFWHKERYCFGKFSSIGQINLQFVLESVEGVSEGHRYAWNQCNPYVKVECHQEQSFTTHMWGVSSHLITSWPELLSKSKLAKELAPTIPNSPWWKIPIIRLDRKPHHHQDSIIIPNNSSTVSLFHHLYPSRATLLPSNVSEFDNQSDCPLLCSRRRRLAGFGPGPLASGRVKGPLPTWIIQQIQLQVKEESI